MNPHFDERPYVKIIMEVGPLSVWLVDPVWTRKHLHREWTNFGHFRDPKFHDMIPFNEAWIASGTNETEWPIFIDHMIREIHYVNQGLSFKRAEEKATALEENERDRFNSAHYTEGPYPDVRIRTLGDAFDQENERIYHILLVDSYQVRNAIFTRFTSGGNGAVYPFVGPEDIWVADELPGPLEWNLNALHELEEATRMFPMMAEGMDRKQAYEKAHPIASRIEFEARWNPLKRDELFRKWRLP